MLVNIACLINQVGNRSIERNLRKLQQDRKLRRVGPVKGGYWEVLHDWRPA